MKIAHVTMFYTPAIGGVKQVVEELAKRQLKDGHDVHVYCCDSDKYKRIKPSYDVIEEVKVHRIKSWFRVSLFTHIWPGLLKELKKEKFDVIHSHVSGHAYVYFAGLIAKKTNTAYIHTTHCPWSDAYRPFLARLGLAVSYNFFNKRSYDMVDKIIAITPWELDFINRYNKDKSKVVVIPNGMDKRFFKKVKPNNFKKSLGLKESDRVVLFFGRLNATKGPEKLVLAGREILKERKDVYFVFIGPDEGMKDTVAKMINGNKNMMLLDPIRDKMKVVEMYQGSDVYAMPSYREGLPLTLFESMASGLPIVASPVNGVSYEMRDNENGFFVEYGDIKGLKEKILKVLDDKKLAKKFRDNNIKRSKEYDWDLIYKRYMKEYKEAIEKKRFYS